jgi:hypothetical protein
MQWPQRAEPWPSKAHARVLARLELACGGAIPFRLAEAPLLLPAGLVRQMEDASLELAARLGSAAYLDHVRALLPGGAPPPEGGR